MSYDDDLVRHPDEPTPVPGIVWVPVVLAAALVAVVAYVVWRGQVWGRAWWESAQW